VLVDLIATRTVRTGKRWKRCDRVEDIADVRASGDAKYARHDFTESLELAVEGRVG
jgi:hypothetical protein